MRKPYEPEYDDSNRRIIHCRVDDRMIDAEDAVIGAAGSHDDVVLYLRFDCPVWEGTTRTVQWFDAVGNEPVVETITTDMLITGTEWYAITVPAEAKAYDGTASMTLKGTTTSGTVEETAVLVSRGFIVTDAPWSGSAATSADITATQAEQYRAELDAMASNIAKAAQAADAKDAAAASANAAAASASVAKENAAAAQSSAAGAAESNGSAKNYAAQAAASALSAAADASTVTTQAGIIGGYAGAAEAAASTATTYGTLAKTSATAAEMAKEQAQQAAKDAEQYATSATTAQSWAVGGTGTRSGEDTDNAKYYAGVAEEQAERMTVPAAEDVYNLIFKDRSTGVKYALIVSDAHLYLLETASTADAGEPTIVDNTTGTGYRLIVENGILKLEEE